MSPTKPIALHRSSPDKFWQGLAAAMNPPDILADPRFSDRFGRIENQEALLPILRDVFKRHTRTEWLARLEQHGVPAAPVYDPSEVEHDPQAQHLGLFIEAEHPFRGRTKTVRFPASFDGKRMEAVDAPPLLGQHNGAIGWNPVPPGETE